MSVDREREPLLKSYGSSSSQAGCLAENSPVASPKVSRGTLIWILTGLWSPIFLAALDGTVVATLISPIGSHFRQSHKASYLGTAYLLSGCCCTPLYGRLSDVLGRKGAMMLALTLFASGTLFCGLAPSMNTLILARAIAGMGGGGILTVASITVSDLVSLKQRGLFQGFVNVIFGVGGGLGGPIGGWVHDTIGWYYAVVQKWYLLKKHEAPHRRWAFLMQIPFLLISMALVMLKVNIALPCSVKDQSTYDKLRRIDWLGSLTLVSGVGCLLLGLSLKTAEDIAWSNPLIRGLLMGSGISFVLFVAVEALWTPAPVMPLRIIAMRTPMAAAIVNLLVSITGFSTLYNIPLYFQAVRLTSASQAGLHLLPNSAALAMGSVFSGWMMRHTGKFYYLGLSSALLTLASAILVATWNESTPAFDLWFDIFPNGFGGSSLFTTVLVALIASVPKEDVAVATGVAYLFRACGQVFGVTLSSALVQAVLFRQLKRRITGPGSKQLIRRIRHEVKIISSLDPPLRKAAVDSYAAALRVLFISQACVAVGTVLICLLVEENSLQSSDQERGQGRVREEPERGNAGQTAN